MNKRRLSILFLGVVLGGALARAQDVVVIVNNSVKATAASNDDIRGVFTGDKSTLGRWLSGSSRHSKGWARSRILFEGLCGQG